MADVPAQALLVCAARHHGISAYHLTLMYGANRKNPNADLMSTARNCSDVPHKLVAAFQDFLTATEKVKEAPEPVEPPVTVVAGPVMQIVNDFAADFDDLEGDDEEHPDDDYHDDDGEYHEDDDYPDDDF